MSILEDHIKKLVEKIPMPKVTDVGIVIIAYGNEYRDCAVKSIEFLHRRFSAPVNIITNVERWPKMKNVSRYYMPVRDNAYIKTRMWLDELSPFRRTLHLDADVLIRRPEFLLPFQYLDSWDLAYVGYRSLQELGGRSGKWDMVKKHLGGKVVL